MNSLRAKLIENASRAWLTNPEKQVCNSPPFQICSPGLPRPCSGGSTSICSPTSRRRGRSSKNGGSTTTPTDRTRASTGSHQPSSQHAPIRGKTGTESTYKRGQVGEKEVMSYRIRCIERYCIVRGRHVAITVEYPHSPLRLDTVDVFSYLTQRAFNKSSTLPHPTKWSCVPHFAFSSPLHTVTVLLATGVGIGGAGTAIGTGGGLNSRTIQAAIPATATDQTRIKKSRKRRNACILLNCGKSALRKKSRNRIRKTPSARPPIPATAPAVFKNAKSICTPTV